MTWTKFAGACFLALFLSSTAKAVTIVDTGPASNLAGSGAVVSEEQSLAAEFSLAGATTITDVEGWFSWTPLATTETLTIAIYDDTGAGSDVPGSELFSAQFALQAPGGSLCGNSASANCDWAGVSGQSWALAAGTYWVVFQSEGPNPGSIAMPLGAPNPLGNEAFFNTANGVWLGFVDSDDYGVRISAVPEPSTALLLALGLAGLSARQARSTAAQLTL